MRIPFALRFAWRDGRAGLRRTGIHFTAIALGVAALVSLHGFRADVERAVQRESRTLLGADLRLGGRRALPDTVEQVVDSLRAAGGRTARVTALLSMVLAPSRDRARLLQLRSIEGAFPFYGEPTVRPRGAWDAMAGGRGALLEGPGLIQLGIDVGDTVRIGTVEVPVVGTVDDLPMEVALQTAAGPRVLVSPEILDRSGLVTFGSMVWYWTYLALPDPDDAEAVQARYRELFRALDVDDDSAAERARDLTEGLGALSRFLSLVGVVALILGGIGVGSAVHAYVSGKVDTVAVLRCVGATQGRVFGAFLLQAGALSFLGAAVGGGLGAVVQRLLPGLLAPILPVTVEPRIQAAVLLGGVGVGVWTGVVFALLPLLGVREIPPLRALRHGFDDEEAGGGERRLRAGVLALLGATVLGLCLWQAPSIRVGLGFAGGLGAATLLLAGSAWVLVRAARSLLPAGAPYAIRQGVSNLFRPRNQTLAVTLTIGGGAFLLAAILGVQESVGARFSVDDGGGRPNLLLFDVQPDQLEGVTRILRDGGAAVTDAAPIVPARLHAVAGRSVEALRSDTSESSPPGWVLNRTYRNTYREEPSGTEEIVEGAWWAGPWAGEGPPEISLELDLARDLGVGPGARITWDVEGRRVETVVGSLRTVDWARFRPNFFVVFQPGVLERDPQSVVLLARAPEAEARARLQARIVDRFANVSVLDLARLQETVDGLLSSVRRTVRFLALFSVAAGLLVLVGSLTATRLQRLQEAALLRTLGARSRQVGAVMASEALVLGAIAGTLGVGLGLVAGASLARFVFELPFRVPAAAVVGLWAGVALLTFAVALAGNRSLLHRPPLPVLRRTEE